MQREGKPTKIDLFNTGRMLGSITGKVESKSKASVFFNNNEMTRRALFNQVLNEPNRQFFGFDNKTEKIIAKQFERFLDKEIRRLGL